MERHAEEKKYWVLSRRTNRMKGKLQSISFPGFEKVSVYEVYRFFVRGISKGSIGTRASSISFNFLLALAPASIFILAFIPYLPVKDFRAEMLELLYEVIPSNSYIAIEGLVDELFNRRGGLQLFGFLVAFSFAYKGINGMIEAFNGTYHTIETRSWMQRQFVSIVLVLIMSVLVFFALVLLFFSKMAIHYLVDQQVMKVDFTYFLLLSGRWVIMFVLTLVSISTLYYLAPAKESHWHFFSVGSVLATILALMASVGFSYFVNHFAQFNNLFGSIGALIAIMLWVNFNSLALLLGFELNVSIHNARSQRET